ncbi:hypothetical protein C8Q74DRAFT_1213969 [Fomes fomentarius]|nr:hypothetical protein C8Q74DRAFT_1213969 [Fomes fomentarius]
MKGMNVRYSQDVPRQILQDSFADWVFQLPCLQSGSPVRTQPGALLLYHDINARPRMFAVHTVIIFPPACANCSHHVTERDVLSRETNCQSVQMTPGGGFFEAHRPKSRFVTMWTGAAATSLTGAGWRIPRGLQSDVRLRMSDNHYDSSNPITYYESAQTTPSGDCEVVVVWKDDQIFVACPPLLIYTHREMTTHLAAICLSSIYQALTGTSALRVLQTADSMGSIARTPALRATNWCASGEELYPECNCVVSRREDLAALGLQIESDLRSREGLVTPTGAAFLRTARRIGRGLERRITGGRPGYGRPLSASGQERGQASVMIDDDMRWAFWIIWPLVENGPVGKCAF